VIKCAWKLDSYLSWHPDYKRVKMERKQQLMTDPSHFSFEFGGGVDDAVGGLGG